MGKWEGRLEGCGGSGGWCDARGRGSRRAARSLRRRSVTTDSPLRAATSPGQPPPRPTTPLARQCRDLTS
eukprot:1333230-Rhodomonas_salina.1